MKKIFTFFLFIIFYQQVQSQFVKFWILEPKSGIFALVNFYTTTTDFSNYRVSVDGTVDTPLSKLPVLVGNINVKGRETVAFSGLPMGKNAGSISLYLPGDTLNHVRGQLYDYAQWGSAGHQNEDSADILKLWKKGSFINASPPFSFKCDEWNFGVQCWQGGKLPIVVMRFAYVSPQSNTFCIKNAGVSNIDISLSSVCINGTCYDTLRNAPVEVVKGTLDIPKGDSLVLRIKTQALDTNKGSLALFALPKQTTDTLGLLDFVQWGDSLQAFSGLAAQKGIWDSMQYVKILRTGDSLRYTGDFSRLQSGAGYWKSFAATNTGVQLPEPMNWFVYPNPAMDHIYIAGVDIAALYIFQMDGREVLNTTQSVIDTRELHSGVYILKAIHKNGVSAYKTISIQH